MSLDELGQIESSQDGGNKSSEISEVFKESIKKASAGIKRTKKDEGKAKKYDLLLAGFLVKIILDKKYDVLLEDLFDLLDKRYSSNFILGILSLVYIDISNDIRNEKNKKLIDFDYISNEYIDFDDTKLDLKVKNRINFWIEDIIEIVSYEYSSIDTKNLIEILKEDDSVVFFISKIFIFFLNECRINIDEQESLKITSFILGEVFKKLQSLEIEEI